jgi:hypothetical protein
VTFTFRASNDAYGLFNVSLRSSATQLRDEAGAEITWEAGDSASILVN